MPNPSGKVNQHEREICARFKLIRETLKQSERNFAKLLFVTRDQVAGIEYARSPLRFGVASSLARATGCNLYWLAEGSGPMFGAQPSPDLTALISPRALFSTAWKTYLKKAVTPRAKHFGENWESLSERHIIQGDTSLEYTVEDVNGLFKDLPDELHYGAYAHIAKACHDFRQMNQMKISELRECDESRRNNMLTHPATYAKSEGVQNQWQSLKARIQKATASPGGKSALAKFLDVDLTQLSKWLTNKKNSAREPGADYTLQMLKWVEAQERQK
jgi:transcriptional regulator with XRE-family HTH domain